MQHRACIKLDKRSLSLIYRSEGHAGNAEAGQNLICSAASILAYTLANTVVCAFNNGWINDGNLNIRMEPGNSEIACIAPDEEVFGELARSFLFAGTGYSLLAQQYPDEIEYYEEITA